MKCIIYMKTFRFCGKYILLTYKTWVDKDELIEFISLKSKREFRCKIAHEKSDKEHKYEHTHILIYFEKRIDFKNERKFDFNGIHPNIKKVITNEHWNNLLPYLEKDNCIFDNFKGDEFKNKLGYSKGLIELIHSKTKWSAVVCDPKLAKEIWNKMKWARCVWDSRERPNLTKDLVLRQWQTKCLDKINIQNSREILWVYDRKGGKGKSVLTNYLIDNCNAFFCNSGGVKDISYAYNYEQIVVFDLPRCNINNDDDKDWTPYRIMEMFKDGRLFSPKYESHMKRFPFCKIVCFANYMPDESKLSEDRWDIWDLENPQNH